MATIWKKCNFLLFSFSLEFFKNSKKHNFDINLVGAAEGYIEKVHAKFQVNRFIRTWNIMLTVLETRVGNSLNQNQSNFHWLNK